MQLIRKYSIVLWTAGMPGLYAKDKKKKTPARESQDAIEVVGNGPGLNGTVTGVRSTQHYSRYYLYVEFAGPGKVTLVDITNMAQPLVLGDLGPRSDNTAASVVAAAGTAVLVSEDIRNPSSPHQSNSVRIMDLSDLHNPRVVREFSRVTAISSDDVRGLIFVADGQGVWILRRNLAIDPEVQKEYERQIMYNR